MLTIRELGQHADPFQWRPIIDAKLADGAVDDINWADDAVERKLADNAVQTEHIERFTSSNRDISSFLANDNV